MKWVVVAIVAILVPYTVISVLYRKEARPFEPYQDMKRQANVHRLLKSGFHRYAVIAERPADRSGPRPTGPRMAVQAAPGGLPTALAEALIEVPLLPSVVRQLAAPATLRAGEPLSVSLVAELPDHKENLGDAYLYARERDLVLVVGFDSLPGTLESRARDVAVQARIPTDQLKPGTYRFTVVGSGQSQSGTLTLDP
jgi:hypothetical protein